MNERDNDESTRWRLRRIHCITHRGLSAAFTETSEEVKVMTERAWARKLLIWTNWRKLTGKFPRYKMVNARTLLILSDVNVDVALKSKSTTSKNPINFEQDVKVALKSKPPPSSGRGENNFPSWMSIAAGLTQHKPCSYATAATHTHTKTTTIIKVPSW